MNEGMNECNAAGQRRSWRACAVRGRAGAISGFVSRVPSATNTPHRHRQLLGEQVRLVKRWKLTKPRLGEPLSYAIFYYYYNYHY